MQENAKNIKDLDQKSKGAMGLMGSVFDFGKSDNNEGKKVSNQYLSKIDSLKKNMRLEMEETEFERKLEIILNESNKGFMLQEGIEGIKCKKIHEIVTY